MFTLAQLFVPPYGREPWDPTVEFEYEYTQSVDGVADYLAERAARYGGTVADILDKTPPHLWDNPDEIRAFWDSHDLSHIYPQSDYPYMADDWTNIVPENPSVNRARGAEIMTHDEIAVAQIESDATAVDIDNTFDGDDAEFANDLIEHVFG